jgi:hypothetical protein
VLAVPLPAEETVKAPIKQHICKINAYVDAKWRVELAYLMTVKQTAVRRGEQR